MNDDPIRVERRQNAAILVIDRPQRKNALSYDAVMRLGEIGEMLSSDTSLRAIVLTGAGDSAFCAGADLKERRGMDQEAVRELLLFYRGKLGWLDASGLPVVAAINGVALGGGLELALLCDLRVAAASALLGLPETGLGIIPGAGGTQRLGRVVGEARAKEMILLASRLTAEQALAIGLVNRVTPSGHDVVEDTLQWIAPILNGAPLAQRAALEAIDASFEVPLEQGLELERLHYERCLRSEDRVEALRAFAEKRKPDFKGR
jgi:enoyl-CoA hydratase/carnithine racemase